MGLLSGFGGLGKAAGGYLSGGIAAEKENYRRNQIATDREQKKQLLALKKKETDPGTEIRKRFGGIAQDLIKIRASPEMQGTFSDPKNVDVTRRYEQAIQHSLDVSTGRVPWEQADSSLLTLMPQQPPLPANEGLDVELPGGRTAAPPDFASQPPGTGVQSPGGGTFIPSVPGDAPPVFVTPRQQQAGERIDLQRGGLGLRERALTLQEPILKSRAKITASAANVAPELDRQKVVGGVAKIEGTRAQTKLTKATTPGKVAKTQAEARLAEQKPKIIEREQARKDQSLEHRKKIDWARLRQQDSQFQRRMTQSEKIQSAKVNSEELKALQAEHRGLMARYQKSESFGPFKESRFAVQGPDREKLGQRIDAIEKRFRAISNKKPTATVTTTQRVSGGSFLGRGASKPAAQASGTKTINGKPYTWKKFLAEGQKRGKDDGGLKKKWAELK
jgi:hypothetical protein